MDKTKALVICISKSISDSKKSTKGPTNITTPQASVIVGSVRRGPIHRTNAAAGTSART
jgi:hypothetical protein